MRGNIPVFGLTTATTMLVALSLLATSFVSAADSVGEPGRGSRKANPLKNVYFGDHPETGMVVADLIHVG